MGLIRWFLLSTQSGNSFRLCPDICLMLQFCSLARMLSLLRCLKKQDEKKRAINILRMPPVNSGRTLRFLFTRLKASNWTFDVQISEDWRVLCCYVISMTVTKSCNQSLFTAEPTFIPHNLFTLFHIRVPVWCERDPEWCWGVWTGEYFIITCGDWYTFIRLISLQSI